MENLFTISWVELIDKREFIKVVLNENFETFVRHIAALEVEMLIYISQATQKVACFTVRYGFYQYFDGIL